MLEFSYTHPRTGAEMEICQAIRVPRGEPFEVKTGQRVEVVCWGVMPSGMLWASGARGLADCPSHRAALGRHLPPGPIFDFARLVGACSPSRMTNAPSPPAATWAPTRIAKGIASRRARGMIAIEAAA